MIRGVMKNDDENARRDAVENYGAVSGLSREEIETILRGMRAVFGEAGRTSLAKVLAGSKAKTVKEEWSRKRLRLTRFWRVVVF